MLPRLMQWFDQALGGRPAAPAAEAGDDFPSSFMSDDKLSVSESTITEYSRAIAAFDPSRPPRN